MKSGEKRINKLEPGSLLVLVCAPPLARRAVPGQVMMHSTSWIARLT